jgi:hypothetical protein
MQRETAERGAQLAGQGEGARVTTVAEGLERRLAALGQDATAVYRGRVQLGEERLRGLALEWWSSRCQELVAFAQPQAHVRILLELGDLARE